MSLTPWPGSPQVESAALAMLADFVCLYETGNLRELW